MKLTYLWYLCSLFVLLLQGCATAPHESPLQPSRNGVIDLGAQAIPACHEVTGSHDKVLCVFAPREDTTFDEQRFRIEAGETDWSKDPDAIGLALSGGGTRAAANAMGVLAGLDDLGLLTHVKPNNKKKVELISSVSGGGYAAYYLYSHLLHPAGLPVERGELFQDCVKRFNETGKEEDPIGETPDKEPYATSALVKALGPYMCGSDTYFKDPTNPQNAWEGDGQHAQARHQAALRCQQDVMSPGKCSSKVTSQDGLATVGSIASLAAVSLLTTPPHHLANSLFDSGLNLSPSRAVYSHGIDLSYGGLISQDFRPSFLEQGILNKKDLRRATRAQITCPKNQIGGASTHANYELHECDERHSYPKPRTWTLEDFANTLNEKRQEQMALEARSADQRPSQVRNHPYWVIQATSAPTRGLAGWLFREVNRKDAWNNSFEFTPKYFGSRRYGFVPGTPAQYEVIDAVASAAAFLDANQQAYDNFVVRPVLAAFQHGLNLNWGIDLPNYNTTPQRRRLHQVLPFPLNNVDAAVTWATNSGPQKDRLISSFIRLTDGGNAENTGVLAMVRRGVRNIVVADAASDDEGSFGDLCHLKQALNPADPASGGQRLHLYLPGLEGFDQACESGGRPASFDLKQWSHSLPLLLGCIQNVKADNSKKPCADPEQVTSRLFIYKPAITYTAWKSASLGSGIDRCKVIRYSPLAAPEAVLLQGAAAPLACSELPADGTHPEGLPSCMNALPCEAARLVRNGSRDFPTGEDAFISSTVAVTANSSGTLYASYRELARHAVHGAHHVLVGNEQTFHQALREQQSSPMQPLKK